MGGLCAEIFYVSAECHFSTELGQKVHWLKCFGELNRCLAMWSYTSPLMQQKLVEEGIVSGIINELKVYNDSPASEVITCIPITVYTQKRKEPF